MTLPLRLLKKHYAIALDTLDEIAELIALRDCNNYNPEELLEKIDDVACRGPAVQSPKSAPKRSSSSLGGIIRIP